MTNNSIPTVSQINSYVKLLLDGDKNLKNVFVSGEISGVKSNYSSGHLYFSLNEGGCVIKAIMFADSARHLRINPQDGMNIIVRGTLSSYPKSGQYQIYVDDLLMSNEMGFQCEEIQKIKDRLEKEGLFDAQRKRGLPKFPSKIGVVTSPSGAVIHDIKSVISRRFPVCDIVVFPTTVQGMNAQEDILTALKYFSVSPAKVDIIILARGGGSDEDLTVFNSEAIAREIASCSVPVISAIGHHKDQTICDFVADVRASTPSVAAELAVPDKKEIFYLLYDNNRKLATRIQDAMNNKLEILDYNLGRLQHIVLENYINLKKQQLRYLQQNLIRKMRDIILKYNYDFEQVARKLDSVNPLTIISKGYAFVSCAGKRVTGVKGIEENTGVELRFYDGKVKFKISKTEVEPIKY